MLSISMISMSTSTKQEHRTNLRRILRSLRVFACPLLPRDQLGPSERHIKERAERIFLWMLQSAPLRCSLSSS